MLLGEKARNENSVQYLFCRQPLQRHHGWSSRKGAATFLPQNYTQRQGAIALNNVYEHLCFISVYFVYSLAGCVLRYQKGLREVIFWV